MVMGFPDPKAEADWIAQTLHPEVMMVAEAGRYPQSQRPDNTTDAVLNFLETSDEPMRKPRTWTPKELDNVGAHQ
jgi:hypothetical protein